MNNHGEYKPWDFHGVPNFATGDKPIYSVALQRRTMSMPMTDPNGAAIYGVPWIPSIYPSHVDHFPKGKPKKSSQVVTTNLLHRYTLALIGRTIIYNLLGGAITILKNMSSSMGRMTSHILWKIENVPNHQPDSEIFHCQVWLLVAYIPLDPSCEILVGSCEASENPPDRTQVVRVVRWHPMSLLNKKWFLSVFYSIVWFYVFYYVLFHTSLSPSQKMIVPSILSWPRPAR